MLQSAIDIAALTGSWSGWLPLTMLSLLISMFIVAIAYMIAEFMRSPQLNAWAKNELYETLLSAFLIANIVVGLTLMNLAIDAFAGGFPAGTYPDGTLKPKHIEFANEYFKMLVHYPPLAQAQAFDWSVGSPDATALIAAFHGPSNLPFGDIGNGYGLLMATDMVLGSIIEFYAMANLPIMPGLLGFAVGLMPFVGFMSILNSLVMVTDFVAMIIISILAQQAFLEFSGEQMFHTFLPLGIVLRAFPITRRLGSTIIAIAITCYVVYPLTLIMNLQIYGAMGQLGTDIAPETSELRSVSEELDLFFPAQMQLTDAQFEDAFGIVGGYNTNPTMQDPDTYWLEAYQNCPWFDPSCWFKRGTVWVYQHQAWLSAPKYVLQFIFSVFFGADYIFNWFIKFVAWAAKSAVITGTLFIIDIIICITFFRSISTSLGGEAQIMGLAKVL